MIERDSRDILRWIVIFSLIIVISVLHYTIPTTRWQYHLLFMQSYFVPIILAAFQFGVRGGLGAAIAVSVLYLPHIMLQWGGLVEQNLMRFLQIILYNVIGYLTGLKAQREKEETKKYKNTAVQLENTLNKVRQQAEMLAELEEQLRQNDRLAVIGELTSSIVHEVRNPLGSIRGAAEIVADDGTSPEKRSEFSKILVEETKKINAVMENYLSFARKKKQRESEYNFQEIIQNVIMMLGAQARKKNIEIASQLPGEPVHILGDPNDLWQVSMNLILNAIQAIEEEGTVTLRLEETEISAVEKGSSRTDPAGSGRFIKFSITDTGPGIVKADQDKIFKPFYTTKADGTGLGLSIVKRIAESNNWQLEVRSGLNSGTEFVLTIAVKSFRSS